MLKILYDITFQENELFKPYEIVVKCKYIKQEDLSSYKNNHTN